jgi:hypothetical protein
VTGRRTRDGHPTSVDIDAMHTYRDAILTAEGQRAVEYAAILSRVGVVFERLGVSRVSRLRG